MSFANTAHSQDLMGFDRASFGSVVLSRTQAVGTDIQLELSIGSYENEPISNYSEGSIFAQMGRSVGRLDVLTDKGVFPCTAFIVSSQHILTNYHCSSGILENERIGATRIDATQFIAGYTQTGIDNDTDKYTVFPTPVETNKELDYAVLEVIGNPAQEYGQLKLASVMPTDGDPFWIIGHPMGEGQRISREKCKANAPAVSAGKLLHTCDTLPGNSGSPVIDAGLQQVVALHHAGSQKDSVNFAILMSEILENSTVLAAYKAPEDGPKSQPVEPKTAANSACDALYSAALEAKACYAYDVYINNCTAHALAPMARGYINEFCQPKETVKVDKVPEKTCDDDPSLCSIDQLCGQSLTFKSGKAAWRTDNGSYVIEAKRRGLNCGVARVEALPKKICREDLSSCLEAELCDMSSVFSQNGRVWTRYSPNQKYVIEAKRRGLSCDVLEAVLEPKKTCREDLSSCLEAELCNLSSVFSQSGKVWTKYAPNQKYVQEAKRRKLTCGVTEAVAKSANKTEVVFSKADFAKLGRTQRKQLQYGLKQLGYYSSSVDGLWGKGTNAGVNSFAKDRNLSSNFPNSVFDALASEVAFANMPVSEPVSEKMVKNIFDMVCKVVNPEAFNVIEKWAGFQVFSGELARPNLGTLKLYGDKLIYGRKQVISRGSSIPYWIVQANNSKGPYIVRWVILGGMSQVLELDVFGGYESGVAWDDMLVTSRRDAKSDVVQYNCR
jgi:V8-like Glu-specific endopeptidase